LVFNVVRRTGEGYWSLPRKVTDSNPNPKHKPNPNVMGELRSKETLNIFS